MLFLEFPSLELFENLYSVELLNHDLVYGMLPSSSEYFLSSIVTFLILLCRRITPTDGVPSIVVVFVRKDKHTCLDTCDEVPRCTRSLVVTHVELLCKFLLMVVRNLVNTRD